MSDPSYPALLKALRNAGGKNRRHPKVFGWQVDCCNYEREVRAMDAVIILGAVVGSFAGAFVLQKAALEGLFRMMNSDRRVRQ
jgi:hypothetical protein